MHFAFVVLPSAGSECFPLKLNFPHIFHCSPQNPNSWVKRVQWLHWHREDQVARGADQGKENDAANTSDLWLSIEDIFRDCSSNSSDYLTTEINFFIRFARSSLTGSEYLSLKIHLHGRIPLRTAAKHNHNHNRTQPSSHQHTLRHTSQSSSIKNRTFPDAIFPLRCCRKTYRWRCRRCNERLPLKAREPPDT